MINNVKEKLITTAFPRSGSTYLNYAFKSLYYPQEDAGINFHTVSIINKKNHLFVPFRNPSNSVVSWHNYPSRGTLEDDIKYYIRFYKSVLNNIGKITLMNFDNFTNSIDYIKQKVKNSLNIDPIENPLDSEIKTSMKNDGKSINLPVNNQLKLDAIKENLLKIPSFQECIDLYNNLKELPDIA